MPPVNARTKARTRAKSRTIDAALQRGRRVYLRHPARGDRRAFTELCAQSEALFTKWEPTRPDGTRPTPGEKFARFIESADTAARQRHLIVRKRDEALLGWVNLNEIAGHPWHNAIMGYAVFTPYLRRGYAVEGVRLALRRAFTTRAGGGLGLHRVEANVMPDNVASLGVVRRAELREEGFSPRYLQIAGVWADHTRWAVTAEEWRRR